MKTKLTLLLGILIWNSYLASAQTSQSKWQSKPIKIDGDGSDWETTPRFFDANSKIKYECRNDAKNLYLVLDISDKATQMQLSQAGFDISLKAKSGNKIKAAIIFPKRNEKGLPPMMNNQNNKKNIPAKLTRKNEIAPKDSAILTGFMYTNGPIVAGSDSENTIIFAKSKLNEESENYEIQIPLNEILGNNYDPATIANTSIQLKVTINSLSANNSGNPDRKPGEGEMGGPQGGMGGGTQGGMGGGPQGGMAEGGMNGGEMRQRPAENSMSLSGKSFKTTLNLSTQTN